MIISISRGIFLFALVCRNGSAFSIVPKVLDQRSQHSNHLNLLNGRVKIRQGQSKLHIINSSTTTTAASKQINHAIDAKTSTSFEVNSSVLGVEQIKDHCDAEIIPSTMSAALHRFFLGPDFGPIIIVGSIVTLVFYRCTMTIQMMDYMVGIGAIIFWWFQEHFIHRHLLHSNWDWMGKQIHKEHHDKTYFHISIDPPVLLMGWLCTAHLLLRLLFPLHLALSATICYAIAGMWYEWTHYIVHTKVRPKSKFMEKVRSNHIRHHLIDDNNWLGFSLPLVDVVFGTNPDVKAVKKIISKSN